MTVYEKMLTEFSEELIVDDAADLPAALKGFYAAEKRQNVILLSKELKTVNEKVCILAEEVGHYYTTAGDITDQSKAENRKQELKARRWAINKLIHIEWLIDAFNAGIRSKYELAEFLGITEEFVDISLQHFKGLYGLYCDLGEYIVYFEPLGVMKKLSYGMDKSGE